jgi:hypothetical protein
MSQGLGVLEIRAKCLAVIIVSEFSVRLVEELLESVKECDPTLPKLFHVFVIVLPCMGL